MPRDRTTDARDFGDWLAARWPTLVRTLLLLRVDRSDAVAIASALVRSHGRTWAAPPSSRTSSAVPRSAAGAVAVNSGVAPGRSRTPTICASRWPRRSGGA